MSIKLCIGNYAQKGYEPEKMGIYVYSLEELCFFIKENACILDESLIDEAMGEWLEQECGLPVLGEEVKKAVIEKTSLKTFVEMLLIFSGFFTSEMNQEIIDTIVKNSSLSMYEKRKAKADMLVRKKHYGLAGREYTQLLEIIPSDMNQLKGEIYQSCGVCIAKMYYYSLAGDYFLKAFELTGKLACYKQYLWTKKLSMSKTEYVNFLQQQEDAYEIAKEIDKKMEQIQEQWQYSHYAEVLQKLRSEKEKGNHSLFQEKLTERVNKLKDNYREIVY